MEKIVQGLCSIVLAIILLAIILKGCGGTNNPSRTIIVDKSPAASAIPTPGAENCNGKVLFTKQIKPLIDQKCISCHAAPQPFNNYQVAKSKIDTIIKRVNLTTENRQRMPLSPNPELTQPEKALFQGWKDSGLLFDESGCEQTEQPRNVLDLDYIETAILNEQNKLGAVDRGFTRFAVLSGNYNAGEDVSMALHGLNKMVNSVSSEDTLVKVASIDSKETVFRFDLRSFGLSKADWAFIEFAEQVNFESFTTKGQLIKALSGARKPWLHGDNLSFTALGGYRADVYYSLLKIPSTIDLFFSRLGVNAGNQLRDFRASLAGGFGSPISLNKNRILSRFESFDGYLWFTFDTVLTSQQLLKRNFFNFPLPNGAGGKAVFVFDAGEAIFTLPNGLHGYALFDATGKRQDFAPLNIVHDVETPFDPTIRVGFSCVRCHASGILPMKDQIGDHIEQNASQFDAKDVEIVRALYRGESANAAIYTSDARQYTKALTILSVVNEQDPTSLLMDGLRRDKNAADVASFLFLSEQEFLRKLNQSADGRARVGQLLTGGSISFQQLLDVLPVLKRDFRLGLDPIDE